MNKTHIYTNYTGIRSQFRLLLLLMAGVFASCTQDGAGVATPLEISAEIGNPQTRANDPHLSDYDKKKFVTDDVIKISKTGSTDVNYKRTAAGNWTPSVPTTPMTTTGSGETFTATFPNDFSSILANQSTPTNFWKSNRLTATAAATGNRVSFSFAPAACKITIIVSFQVDNSSGSAKVTGKGLCSGNATEETITLLKTSEAVRRHTYSGIFSPKAATSYTISVTASPFGTRTYQEKGSGLTFQAGYEYQYTFTGTNELNITSVVVKDFAVDGNFGTDGEEDAGNAT